MQHPSHQSGQQENPYAPYTQDAQNWENERLRLVREEQNRRDQEYLRAHQEEMERKARENRPAPRPATNTTLPAGKAVTPTSKAEETNAPSFKDVITVIGAVAGAIMTYQTIEAHWVAAVIGGVITGVITRKTYKLIIAILILLGSSI